MDDNTIAVAADGPPEVPRLTMGLVVSGVVERFFDVEQGWLRTVRELTLGPGAMIRRYVQGHRKVYANPFAYLVVGTAVSFIVQGLVGFQERMVATTSGSTVNSPLQMEFANRFTELIFQNALYVSLGIVELLIERGADVNLQDIHGRVPMFVALAEHQPEIAKHLAEHTDPYILTADGSTLLMAAARAEDVELVQWALDHGIEVNAIRPGKNNATALILAARKGNPEIVSLLLAAGADPGAVNEDGEAALDLAKGREVKELLEMSAE